MGVMALLPFARQLVQRGNGELAAAVGRTMVADSQLGLQVVIITHTLSRFYSNCLLYGNRTMPWARNFLPYKNPGFRSRVVAVTIKRPFSNYMTVLLP